MKEFGNTHYTQTVYINFEKNQRLQALFTADFDIKRIIVALQAESGLTIKADNTLLIFDETSHGKTLSQREMIIHGEFHVTRKN